MDRARLKLLFLIFSFLFVLLLGRLVYLSLLQDDQKSRQIFPEQSSPLFRGDIYTLNKDILAVSLPFYSIFIDPSLVDHTKTSEYKSVLSVFGMSTSQIQNILQSSKKFHWISRMLPKTTFFSLQKYLNLSLPGITVKQEYKRVYPHDDLAASIIGFSNIDGLGLAGIEYSMNKYLEPNLFSEKQHQLLGHDIVLTIDSQLQQQVEKTIQAVGRELSPQSISTIIMEADTGRLLSMANYPSFNPNIYNTYRDPQIFLNAAISHIDEPGSTFKPLVMAYLFDKHLISEKSRFSSKGQEKIHGLTIREALKKPLGTLTPQDILTYSSNIGMAKASQGLSKEDLYNILDSLYLGRPTGILLPGEESGIVRSPRNMTERSRLVIPIGQEIGLTPLQLVSAFSAIANEGVQVFPKIIDHLEYEGKPFPFNNPKSTNKSHSVYTPASANLMLQYMHQVVLKGSARKVNIPGEWIAAKTGTAQIFNTKKGAYTELNTSIIAIYKDSRTHRKYVVYGVIRDPKVDPNIAWGGTLAAPMVKDLILALRENIKNIEPVG